MNSVHLSGNLTRDPELVNTAGGTSLARFGVAVEQNVKSGDSWDTKTHFVDCTVFAGRAEVFAAKARKGDLVSVEGRLDFSTWEKDGEKRSKLAVVANEIEGEWKFRKSDGSNTPARSAEPAAPSQSTSVEDDDDIPF